jgi:hypothetical protein
MAREHLNAVEVDVEAELAALEREASVVDDAELEHATAEAGHDPEQWRQGASWIVALCDAKVCPAWELTEADRLELADKLALVLDHYFPGGVAGTDNWHPLWQLSFAIGVVSLTRGFDFERLAFKPLHPKADDNGTSEATERHEHLRDGDDPQRENGSGFSLGGG